ncbi:Ku protein [Streptomyces sp. NPDC102259]|uniref:non-homologous end joining protein Ku n=1 Tax=Streptomyces sp. NPDC102259 TaxID=3366148 RepID=UPI0038154E6E
MRATATWSGTIAFGMVSIPVQLYAATEEHTARLHEIDTADGSRVQHRRFCAAEGREIPYSEVGRGVAVPDGRMLPLSEDDLARLPLPTKHTITVAGFIEPTGVVPLSYDRPYYVAPAAPEAERPYALLVEVLSRTGLVAMAKVAIRSRERRAVVRPYAGMLLLQTLRWRDEIRDPGDLAHLVPAVPLSDRERRLAEVLVQEILVRVSGFYVAGVPLPPDSLHIDPGGFCRNSALARVMWWHGASRLGRPVGVDARPTATTGPICCSA